MKKFCIFLDKDKETTWLNQMAADGWAMESFLFGVYDFVACEKGAYVYQVDFGDKLFCVSSEYRELMQDIGVEIVQTWGYWVILRKKTSEGSFELYTDAESSIAHYKKIRRMFKIVTLIEMLGLFLELYLGAVHEVVVGYAAALLFAVILLGLFKVLVRLNYIIADLEEKLTGVTQKYRSISSFWLVGLMLNTCSLIMMDVLPHLAFRTMQILAITLMLVGIFRTVTDRKTL